MRRAFAEMSWACLFVAILAIIVLAFRPAAAAPEPQPTDLRVTIDRVTLDLTETALTACLTAFIRFGLGGPVADYECRVEGPSVALYGPSWNKFSQHADGKPPVAKLGAVGLEVAAK